MDDSYFETFAFHSGSGNSPMCELTVTNCSPGLSITTPSTTDPITGEPLSSYGSMHEAAQTFAAELERRHSEVYGRGSAVNHGSHSPYETVTVVRTPDAMLMPLQRQALKRLSLASSICSSAPSTATSEVDGSEDLDREFYGVPAHRRMPPSDSASTIASVPDLVASRHHLLALRAAHEDGFRLSDFIADAEATDAFESELDKAVDSAQALTLSAASYNTPQRPSLFHRSPAGTSSIFGTQGSLSSLASNSSSSPESSPGSPCTPASMFGFEGQQSHQQQQSTAADETVIMKEEQEATLRARRNMQSGNPNRQTILCDPEGIFGDQSFGDHSSTFANDAEEARAGLGLFDLHGAHPAASHPLSRSSSFSNYDTLSCNPADIAPRSSGINMPATLSPALIDAQQAASSGSHHGRSPMLASSPSPMFNNDVALPSPSMLHPSMSHAIARSPLKLYSSDSIPRSGSLVEQAISAADANRDGSTSMLSCSLPNPNYAPPSPSPLGHGFPQRPGSSLGPMRRPSTISTHSASPYSRTIELAPASGSPLPSQRHFNESTSSLLLTPSSLGPASPALSAHSGASIASGSSVSAASYFADPVTGVITKRSRGRRVPNNPEEMNNLGKSGKVYTCKVPGCGKCFKRSEHLKRHVRSIHTEDKRELLARATVVIASH